MILALVGAVCAAAQEQQQPPSDIVPPTSKYEELAPLPDWGTRGADFGRGLVGMPAITGTIPSAAYDEVTNFPHEWKRNAPAIGKRVGSEYGQFVTRSGIEFGVAAWHHEDLRYYRMPGGTFRERLGHVIAFTFVVRNSDGTGSTAALGSLAGAYGSWAIAQTWEPKSATGVGNFFYWGSANLLTRALANTVREFWPDAKRKLFAKSHGGVSASRLAN
ncbi:MAG TPA: hypothetical protein VGL53_02350 [Bryobacteraceae bacterium]|jgi:hypothetical protein